MKSSEKASRVVAATLILLVGVAVVGGGGLVSYGSAAGALSATAEQPVGHRAVYANHRPGIV